MFNSLDFCLGVSSHNNLDNPKVEHEETNGLPRQEPPPKECGFGWKWRIRFVGIGLYGFVFHEVAFLMMRSEEHFMFLEEITDGLRWSSGSDSYRNKTTRQNLLRQQPPKRISLGFVQEHVMHKPLHPMACQTGFTNSVI